MKKVFKITLNNKVAVDLEIEGDDDLVEKFITTTLTDTFGAFYKTRDAFSELVINGIKREIQIVTRGADGKFKKVEK